MLDKSEMDEDIVDLKMKICVLVGYKKPFLCLVGYKNNVSCVWLGIKVRFYVWPGIETSYFCVLSGFKNIPLLCLVGYEKKPFSLCGKRDKFSPI